MSRKIVNFRASPQLIEALAAMAAREGVSVSDLVRQAAEEKLAKQADTHPEARATFDPFGHLSAAARGSLQAQRAIANAAAVGAFERDEAGELVRDPEMTLVEGLVFARLAAAQGEIADQGLVISMIGLLASVVGGENMPDTMGEAVARLAKLADLGVDLAADNLPWVVDGCSPETVAMATSYVGRIEDEALKG